MEGIGWLRGGCKRRKCGWGEKTRRKRRNNENDEGRKEKQAKERN